MQNLSLRTRLLAWLLIPTVMLAFMAWGSFTTIENVGQQFEQVTNTDLAFVTTLDSVKYYGTRVISSTNELILDYAIGREGLSSEDEADDTAGEIDQINEAKTGLWAAYEQYQSLIAKASNAADFEDDTELADTIGAAARNLVATSDQVLALQEQTVDLWQILEARTTFEATELTFLDAVGEALDEEVAELAERQVAVKAEGARSTNIGLTMTVLSFIFVTAASYVIYRSINGPLKKLQQTAHHLSRGNLEARTGIEAKDELGQLAKTIDHMANDLEVSISELEEQTILAVEARERAERSDSVKSQFLASVSHELRTPLNAVLNFTQFVSTGMMGQVNERQTEALNKVYNSAAHLLDLINDVLDISKIEADSLQLFIEDNVNLKKELGVVIDSAESALKGKPVRLHVNVPEELPLITGDRQRIRQIMLNLMGNACKFTEEGDISLKVAQENGNVTFTLSDTGPGIPPEDQTTIFDPFQQGKAGLKHGGTGLGLPITKRLIEAHGGDIRFETEEGKGTTFIVHLPVQSKVAMPTPA